MRGVGDQLSIGERIAFYRRRRGLSQVILANLVGRTEDWLSKIERGEREIRRLDVLADVARALRGRSVICWVNPCCWSTRRSMTTFRRFGMR
jgi:transcriptional regulator with XRE-family HTH domain